MTPASYNITELLVHEMQFNACRCDIIWSWNSFYVFKLTFHPNKLNWLVEATAILYLAD